MEVIMHPPPVAVSHRPHPPLFSATHSRSPHCHARIGYAILLSLHATPQTLTRWVGTFQEIARHVVRVHASAGNVGSDDPKAKQDENWLKRSPAPLCCHHLGPRATRLWKPPGFDTRLTSCVPRAFPSGFQIH